MKLFNLTDVLTDALLHQGLVSVPIRVAGTTIAPGGWAVVPKRFLPQAKRYLGCGAMAVGEAPASYIKAKETAATVPYTPIVTAMANDSTVTVLVDDALIYPVEDQPSDFRGRKKHGRKS